MRRWRVGVSILVLSLVAGCLAARMASAPNLGPEKGRLAPCPSSPNCVCSQANDPAHQVAPLAFTGPPEVAFTKLQALVSAQPRAKIVGESPGYFHAEYRSALFRFADDVEFLLDESNRVIQVRSASRVGHSDLGVNRRRVETLRAKFAASER
jgi:uncharacterized protein (DUF1499 family)